MTSVEPLGPSNRTTGFIDPGSEPALELLLSTTKVLRKRLDLNRAVDRSVIERCIELACYAPSAENRQQYRWLVIDDPGVRARVAEVWRAARAGLHASGRVHAAPVTPTFERMMASADYLAEYLHEVPVLVLPVLEGPLPGPSVYAQSSAWGSILPAVWNFLLALRVHGLGAAWTTVHLHDADSMADLLGIPDGFVQVGLFPVAHAVGETFRRSPRRDPRELTWWNAAPQTDDLRDGDLRDGPTNR